MEEEKVDTSGLILDDQYFTTLAFVEVNENGERTFSFARKPVADTQTKNYEILIDVLDRPVFFTSVLFL